MGLGDLIRNATNKTTDLAKSQVDKLQSSLKNEMIKLPFLKPKDNYNEAERSLENKPQPSKSNALITILKALGIIVLASILIVFLLAFGWIAGGIWLIFFRGRMSSNPKKQTLATIIISTLSVFSFIFLILLLIVRPLQSITISSRLAGQELEVGQDYFINIKCNPKDASLLTFDYNISSPCATFTQAGTSNTKAVLHTVSEGSFTITVSCGKVTSNPLQFTVAEHDAAENTPQPTDTSDKNTTGNFIDNVKNAIAGDVGKGESITDVKLNDKDLCIYIDITNCDTGILTLEDLAISRTSSITDDILDLEEYDELWETITVDFGNIGKITNSKADIETNDYGLRYFPIENFVIENNGSTETDSGANSETKKNELQVIAGSVDVSFSQSVNEDETGNWRLACVSTMKPIQDYALDYCNAFFQSDDEVHAIINFALNTTNKLTKVSSDLLYITVYNYVDGEGSSAKTLFSGTVRGNYFVNTTTGEITEIPSESDDADMSAAGGGTGESASDESPNNADTITPSEEMVWIDDTGKKYHSHSSCSNMSDPYQIPKSEAEARGRGACKKCY